MNNKEEAESDYSVHCNIRGGDCYNPTCLLNGKCIDFINRESYLQWKDDECKKAIRATELLRMMDAMSAIQEANELREQIKQLRKDKEQIVSDFKAVFIQEFKPGVYTSEQVIKLINETKPL